MQKNVFGALVLILLKTLDYEIEISDFGNKELEVLERLVNTAEFSRLQLLGTGLCLIPRRELL